MGIKTSKNLRSYYEVAEPESVVKILKEKSYDNIERTFFCSLHASRASGVTAPVYLYDHRFLELIPITYLNGRF